MNWVYRRDRFSSLAKTPTTVLALTFSVITTIALIPSLLFSVFGGSQLFFEHQVYEFHSPDGKYRVNVSRKVDFPVIDILGPSAKVYVSLKRTGSWGSINEVQFSVWEFDDLTEPQLNWSSTEVVIDNIDNRRELALKFRFPKSE